MTSASATVALEMELVAEEDASVGAGDAISGRRRCRYCCFGSVGVVDGDEIGGGENSRKRRNKA